MGAEVWRQQLKDLLVKLAALGILIGVGGFALVMSLRGFAQGGPRGVATFVFLGLPAGVAAGVLAWRWLFFPLIDGGVVSLLGSNRKLPRPPLNLAPCRALVATGNYQQGREELEKLQLLHPDNPEIALMLAELWFDVFREPAAGLTVIENYFRHAGSCDGSEPLRMLLRYADYAAPQDAIRLFRHELKRKTAYHSNDTIAMVERLHALLEKSS